MRRLAELTAFAAAAVALIATSPMKTSDCAAETLTVQASSTCGPPGPVVLTSTPDCSLSAEGGPAAGLPGSGRLAGRFADAGIRDGFVLDGYSPDAGATTCATVSRRDGTFAIQCGTNCWNQATADGGFEGDCASTCEGNLTP